MTQTPSSDGGATPTSDPQPATGTASGGATPQKPSVTLEEALVQIAELKHAQENAEGELKRHRSKLSAYEKAEQDAKAAKEAAELAQLAEIDQVKKQQAKAEERIKQYQQELVTAQVKLAAQAKGIIDPDLAALALSSKNQAWTLEYGADGMPTNLEAALDMLIKNKPIFAPKPAEPPGTPAPDGTQPPQAVPPGTPALPAMNPGRTSIAQPGQFPAGKPLRLTDPGVFSPPGTRRAPQ